MQRSFGMAIKLAVMAFLPAFVHAGGAYNIVPFEQSRMLTDVTVFCLKQTESSFWKPLDSKWEAKKMESSDDPKQCDERVAMVNKYDKNGRMQARDLSFFIKFDRQSKVCDKFMTNDYTPARSKFYYCTSKGVEFSRDMFEHAVLASGIEDVAISIFAQQEQDQEKSRRQKIVGDIERKLNLMTDDQIVSISLDSIPEEISQYVVDRREKIYSGYANAIEGISSIQELDELVSQKSSKWPQKIIDLAKSRRLKLVVLEKIKLQREAEAEKARLQKEAEAEKARLQKEAAVERERQIKYEMERYEATYLDIIKSKSDYNILSKIDTFISTYGSNDPKKRVPEIKVLREKAYIDAYHRDYNGLSNYGSMVYFVKTYGAKDPENLIPLVRKRMPAAKVAQDALEAKMAKAQKEAEKIAAIKGYESRIDQAKKNLYAAAAALANEKEVSNISGVDNLGRRYVLGQRLKSAKDDVDELYAKYLDAGGEKSLSDL